MKRFYSLLALLSLMSVEACAPDQLIPDDPIKLSVTEKELDYSAQTFELSVTSSEDWWTTGEYDWIDMSVEVGAEEDKVVFDISRNKAGIRRSAIIAFQSAFGRQLLTIIQQSGGDEEKPLVPEGSGMLTGTIIGSKYSVDYYNGNSKSTFVNTKAEAFDGNLFTYFAAYDGYQSWVGLDLGEKHVITKVGWAPRPHHLDKVELALFEGANKADFSDALCRSGVLTGIQICAFHSAGQHQMHCC